MITTHISAKEATEMKVNQMNMNRMGQYLSQEDTKEREGGAHPLSAT